jgi:hypothetical protein
MKNLSFIGSHGLLTVAFAALLGAAGGCTISAQADVPDVEVTQHGISIPGVPAGAAAFLSGGTSGIADTSTKVSFNQTLPDLNLPKDLTSTVKAVKVDFIAKDGIKDFSFLHGLRVTMTPKGSTTVTELINYQTPDGTTIGKTLSIDSQNPVNILDQWKTDSATFNVEVMGALPSATWTFDMAVHFSGQVTYKY